MTAVTEMVTEDQTVDLDRIEADATARLAELTEQRARLALDALVDADVQAELESVESEVSACEQAIQRVALARGEQGRREQAAAQAAEDERRQAALDRARGLQVERESAVRAIDSGLRKAATAWADYSRVCVDQQRELRAAGRPDGGPAPSSAIERALAKALEGAAAPPGMIDLPPLSGRPALLAELDPRLVEPAEVKP